MARSTAALGPAAFSTFGELLRYLRRRQRLTQIDLAIAVGYSTAQISRLEQNQRLPNPSTIHALFVPALGIEGEPELAARLVELARAARDGRDADAWMSDPESAVAGLADPEPHTPHLELKALESPPNAQILVTKLYLPRPRPDLVARPRLLARLDAALTVPLTLVSAPAGFGKTTLLAVWLAEFVVSSLRSVAARSMQQTTDHGPRTAQVAWLSLDDGDNDPSTFLRYLIAAFQTIAPMVGRTALALLQTSQPPAPEMLLRVLLNDLAALPQECLLTLDDYHLITTPAIHAALAFLVDHLPPQLHLVLASRADPPLPVARLRARGQLVELRAADLRFTPAEATTFLTDGMGLPLSAAQVAALEMRTEGWIAGLQLAALAMRDRSDLADFLSAFTGSNRFVGDYLVAEVFVRQPPHLQAFLLQTSILDRMCGALCDAVMGIETLEQPALSLSKGSNVGTFQPADVRSAYSQLVLEQLERSNLFTIGLDDERRWYRYHHLFGEALRERLISGATEAAIATLHRRASAWYAGHGLVVEAVHHALAAQDWERAACLIEEQGLQLILSGQVHTVLGWLNAIPTDFLQLRPILIVHYAAGLMFTYQIDAAEGRLHDAERALQDDTPDELARLVRGRVALCRGIIRCLAGNLAPALAFLQQALALLPETTADVTIGIMSARARAAAAVYVAATTYQLTGDVTTASERRAADAIAPVRAAGYVTEILHSYTSLAFLQVLQGRLRAAAATYAEVERLVVGQDALQALIGSPSYYFGMGDLLREWNQLDAAEGYLARGMELVQGTLATEADVIMRGYLALARVQQARGHSAAALATLEAFMQLARERQFVQLLIDQAAMLRARLQLLQGDLPAAMRWADGSDLSPDDEISFPREAAYLTLARLRIAAGRAEAVVPLLHRLLADAEAHARLHSAIEIRTLQALANDALGDRPRALMMLKEALALAEPEGYVRSFVDEGAPLVALLRELRAHGMMQAYVDKLMAA